MCTRLYEAQKFARRTCRWRHQYIACRERATSLVVGRTANQCQSVAACSWRGDKTVEPTSLDAPTEVRWEWSTARNTLKRVHAHFCDICRIYGIHYQPKLIYEFRSFTKAVESKSVESSLLDIAQIPLGSSRLDSTRLDTFDVSSPCILAVSSLSNSTARLARHDESDLQLSLLCNFYKVMITAIRVLFNVSYSLIYWFHLI